ncbi:MAG: DUF2249 domain-containing protein [Firmicutes bacterium]|nr:DUF2249 domain-containing protein [Bacillota bacterium]
MESDVALTLNAWTLPSNVRHEVIFKVLEALPLHQSLMLVNDHDPKPLFYQLDAEKPGMFRHQPATAPSPEYFAVTITRHPVPGDIPLL